MLRLLSRRRCLSCGEELPPPREYPMRVCAACILAPLHPAPHADAPTGWAGEDEGGRDDCA